MWELARLIVKESIRLSNFCWLIIQKFLGNSFEYIIYNRLTRWTSYSWDDRHNQNPSFETK